MAANVAGEPIKRDTVEPGGAEEKCSTINMSAWRSARAHGILWGLTGLGFLLDQASKRWALGRLGDNEILVFIRDYFYFQLAENDGAAGGVLGGRTGLLVTVSLVAVGFLLWLFVRSSRRRWLEHVALGLLLGGALGNLYDRVFNAGKVIDFIVVNLHFRPFDPWPTFNIADSLLCVGVALLLITMWRQERSRSDEQK